MRGRPKKGKGGGGSKVPAGMQQYGASGSNRGKRKGEGSPVTKKYEHGGRR